eukprot:scaffold2131_cov18-Tisochrysis_lutea.AAC.1
MQALPHRQSWRRRCSERRVSRATSWLSTGTEHSSTGSWCSTGTERLQHMQLSIGSYFGRVFEVPGRCDALARSVHYASLDALCLGCVGCWVSREPGSSKNKPLA